MRAWFLTLAGLVPVRFPSGLLVGGGSQKKIPGTRSIAGRFSLNSSNLGGSRRNWSLSHRDWDKERFKGRLAPAF